MRLPRRFSDSGLNCASQPLAACRVLCALCALCMVLTLASVPAFAAADGGRKFSHWLALRDAGVVKQERDFSCGVAALATYFTAYLNDPLSEADLLQVLQEQGDRWELPADWREQGVSYAILLALAAHYGVQGAGLAVTPERLMSLRVPAIVRLHVDGGAHFSVLRGIDAAGRVHLADPSWGNRQFSRAGFLKLWLDPERDGEEVGTLLLLQDIQAARRPSEGYFSIEPRWPLLRPPG